MLSQRHGIQTDKQMVKDDQDKNFYNIDYYFWLVSDTQFLTNAANCNTIVPHGLLYQRQTWSIVLNKSKIIVRTHIQCSSCFTRKPVHPAHFYTVTDNCKHHTETEIRQKFAAQKTFALSHNSKISELSGYIS